MSNFSNIRETHGKRIGRSRIVDTAVFSSLIYSRHWAKLSFWFSDELPFTSYVRIVVMSGRCVNCSLRCEDYLCRHCKDHVQCVNCRRYLPSHCYSDASKRCFACARKLAQTRSSVRNIVNEVNITTAHGTESFDSFVVTNSGLIQAFVEDY